MLIIFDFDYTLFDVIEFKKGLAAAFEMTFSEFAEEYRKNFKERKVNYNTSKHIKILKDKKIIGTQSEQNIKKQVNKLFKSSDEYVFQGINELLKELKSTGHNLILLSSGDKEFQNSKIKNTNIAQYFSKIITSDSRKNKFLKFLKSGMEEILIVNDNALESVMMKNALGRQSKIFLVKGPYSGNIKHSLKVYNSVNELNSLICKP